MVKTTIQARFETFQVAHPEVLTYLLRFAREYRMTGRKRAAIGLLWERVRWHIAIERGQKDTFKLNDHFRSRYARKLMEDYPEFAGFFETRKIRTT